MPEETTISMLLEETPDGKTQMTFCHAGMPNALCEMAAGGWGQAFDKMDQLVEA